MSAAEREIAEIASGASGMSITAVAGGRDRVESVRLALRHSQASDLVLVHDAARCLTPPEVFRRVVAALDAGAEAVVPVLPMTDTVRRVSADGTLRGDLDRKSLRRIQTPQGFTSAILERAHASHRDELDRLGARAREATDDAGLVERLGVDVVAVDGHEEALKITYPLDLVVGEHIARLRDDADASEARP
ncbi:2-C-methyl-D-erythritol 4-phosphate cytidylyltransferase [Brevibacterium sanguinis]|uniref:2-C-methyl-D-erythritol 4-phosphate cytidylyltransferase n=2 Tax=Brevibacterium TaxID=1696 RepID=A0A366IJA8_9MICO|nr:2-C-methyl-D-erythritol 4-phosphate cytidylyltransferase [Brevibacterium sanguinis]RBP72210.1 2-C-methyl-D-erythritol 4-phosphate cytidylyltransferase [Brevibacterium celere]